MNLEVKEQTMKIMYEEATILLKEICPKNIDLAKYFNLKKSFKSKSDILHILLICLQDKQMADKVIGITRPERKEVFRKLLFDYDCEMILTNYNEESLLQAFNKNFKINNLESKQNMWRQYAKSIISSVHFLGNFKNAEEFDIFIMQFKEKPIELITLLQKQIFGMGFALACHFLKELGYKEYAKPASHLIDLFVALNISEGNEYSVFNAILEMANIVQDTPYNLDKLFWLICSGNFHMDNIMVEKNKEELIRRVKKVLRESREKEIPANKIKRIEGDFTVCQVKDFSKVDLNSNYCFIGKTEEEYSLVCLKNQTPSNTIKKEDGWKAFKIEGKLDFSLIGILSKIATILAENKIGIYAVSTYDTDYILVKEENYEKALKALSLVGYEII